MIRKTVVAAMVSPMLALSTDAHAANFAASNQAQLIAAINAANGDAVADTINITADIELGALSAGATNSLPEITTPITINGSGHTLRRAPGNTDDFRIIEVAKPGSLILNDSIITGGSIPTALGGAIFGGEGVSVTITDSTLYSNTGGSGGAIFVGGNMSNSEISFLTVVDSDFTENEAASGGAISTSWSEVEISGSVIERNYASLIGGGGIRFSNSTGNGVASTSLRLEQTTISNNSAYRAGGGLEFLTGPGDYSRLYIENSTISGNTAGLPGSPAFSRKGGAISADFASVSIFDSTISGNSSGNSGAGVLVSEGRLDLRRSRVAGNHSSFGRGGGISLTGNTIIGLHFIGDSTVSNNSANDGGGIFNQTGSLRIQKSTITGNSAIRLNSGDYARGGGVFSIRSPLDFYDSTLSGNFASDAGGGVYIDANFVHAEMKLRFATLTGNRIAADAVGEGAGVQIRPVSGGSASISMQNSIIGNSSGGLDCATQVDTTVTNTPYNLIEDGSCGLGTLTGDPQLGGLKNNGGPTSTHLPLTGSPVLNAADPAQCIGFDQRGEPRSPAPCALGAANGSQEPGSFFVVPLPDGKVVVFEL